MMTQDMAKEIVSLKRALSSSRQTAKSRHKTGTRWKSTALKRKRELTDAQTVRVARKGKGPRADFTSDSVCKHIDFILDVVAYAWSSGNTFVC